MRLAGWIVALLVIVSASVGVSLGHNAVAKVIQPDTTKPPSNDRLSPASEAVPQKVFKAEKDWKVIQPDEAVPRGLHIRINLQTGQKEAKLLDEAEETPRSDAKYTPEQLKHYLKGVKNEASELKETDTSKYRDMATIKKEFDELNLKPVQSESHTIQELLTMFRKSSATLKDKQDHLKEMEYLLHQYDVAKDFVKMGGIRDLLHALNSTELRTHAALALGAALQGNPEVQQAALAAQGVHSLLLALRSGCGPHCVFGLSTLLRQFPKAQKSFLHEGGAAILSEVFSKKNASPKLKLKIVTLLSDLLIERSHAMSGQEGDPLRKSYSGIDLRPSVVDAGFCELISSLLASSNEDVREKVLHALHTLVGTCKLTNLVPHLESLRSHYRFRMHEEGLSVADEYFEGLHHLTEDLIKHITDANHSHAEL